MHADPPCIGGRVSTAHNFRGQIGGKIQMVFCPLIHMQTHRILVGMEVIGVPPDHCGSELARESGGSGNAGVECAGAFASKPAPTGIVSGMKIVGVPRIIVGASLLAKAVVQAMQMLNVLTPSRASPLPQESWLGWRSLVCPGPLWERACSRKRWFR